LRLICGASAGKVALRNQQSKRPRKETPMIDVYFWPTPNGYKVTVMCEEVGLKYNIIPVNIGRGDQFKPEFLKISPNNKMPAIIDHDGPGGSPIAIFESGAILMYLAEKTGKLMPSDTRGKYNVIQWLMFQMGTVGPMLGQAHHFRRYAPEKLEYAINRYTNEARRIYNVIDRRLAEAPFLAGEYSIADIATYPWLVPHAMQGQNLDDYPNLKRWYEEQRARPAVQRGFAAMAEEVARMRAAAQNQAPQDKESWNNLFGNKQYERR
jgi:GSH-dependent disulfide-bond oxidoreductase